MWDFFEFLQKTLNFINISFIFSVNQTCKRFEIESKLKKFNIFNTVPISYANMLKENIQENIPENGLKRDRTSNERILNVDINGNFR